MERPINPRTNTAGRAQSIERDQKPDNTCKIFFPGATAGGPSLTGAREALHNEFGEDIFIPASITTERIPFTNKRAQQLRYRELDDQVVKSSNGRDIKMLTHSFGGYESMYFMNELLKHPDFHPEKLVELFKDRK